jgi:hypothetical protein
VLLRLLRGDARDERMSSGERRASVRRVRCMLAKFVRGGSA